MQDDAPKTPKRSGSKANHAKKEDEKEDEHGKTSKEPSSSLQKEKAVSGDKDDDDSKESHSAAQDEGVVAGDKDDGDSKESHITSQDEIVEATAPANVALGDDETQKVPEAKPSSGSSQPENDLQLAGKNHTEAVADVEPRIATTKRKGKKNKPSKDSKAMQDDAPKTPKRSGSKANHSKKEDEHGKTSKESSSSPQKEKSKEKRTKGRRTSKMKKEKIAKTKKEDDGAVSPCEDSKVDEAPVTPRRRFVSMSAMVQQDSSSEFELDLASKSSTSSAEVTPRKKLLPITQNKRVIRAAAMVQESSDSELSLSSDSSDEAPIKPRSSRAGAGLGAGLGGGLSKGAIEVKPWWKKGGDAPKTPLGSKLPKRLAKKSPDARSPPLSSKKGDPGKRPFH
jgi:hypothetical protein